MTSCGWRLRESGQPGTATRRRRKLGLLAAAWSTATLAAGAAFGQCAMCYATAASQGPQARHALNLGILLLILPVASIIGGIAVVTYRNRNSE